MDDARARSGEPPASVRRAMENLKTALRLKLDGSELAPERARAIAAALDAATLAIERGLSGGGLSRTGADGDRPPAPHPALQALEPPFRGPLR
jgi:hypothetical protein